MSYLADNVASYLAGLSYGVVGTTMFVNSKAVLPVGVGPYTAIRDTGGPSALRAHSRVKNPYARATAQLMVHATRADVAKAKAEVAFYLLILRNVTINDMFYLEIDPIQSKPFDMGEDEIGRARFTFNIGSNGVLTT